MKAQALAICVSLLAVLLSGVGMIVDGSLSFATTNLALVQALFLVVIILLVKHRSVLTGLACLYLVQPIVTVVAINFVLAVPFSSWRESAISAEGSMEAVRFLSLSIALFLCGATISVRGSSSPIRNGRDAQNVIVDMRKSVWPYAALAVGSISILALGAYEAIKIGRNAIVADDGGRYGFLFSLAWVGALVALVAGILRQKRIELIFCLIISGISCVFAAAGFRAMLVSVLSILCAVFLRQVRLSASRVAGLVVLGFTFTFILIFFGAARGRGVEPEKVLTAISNGELSLDDIGQFVGAAEQNLVYSYVYFFDIDCEPFYGESYITAIQRLGPSNIFGANRSRLRSQDYIAEAAPAAFAEMNLNLGAYFPAEALVNWGRAGSSIFSLLAGFTIGLVDLMLSKRRGVCYGEMLYYGGCALAFSFMLYGFSNSIKTYLAYGFIAVLFCFIDRPMRPERGHSA